MVASRSLSKNIDRISSCLQIGDMPSDQDLDRAFGIDQAISTAAPSLIQLLSQYGNAQFDATPLSYGDIRCAVSCLHLRPIDVIYDVGCGHGRILFYVGLTVAAPIRGVEIVADRCQALATAVRRWGLATVSVVCADALNLTFPDATVLFVNNPFFREDAALFLSRMAAGQVGPETRIVAFNGIVGQLRLHPGFEEISVDCDLPRYRFGVFRRARTPSGGRDVSGR